jgi:putative ABC transport system permease protein
MRALTQLLSFLRFIFRRRTVERQMDDELTAHVAQRIDDLCARGLTLAEAEKQARAELGSPLAVKDDMRGVIPAAMSIDAWTKDVRHAFRRMVKAPGFTLVAVVTLALGIGGTSAIFTVVKAVLLDPPPYRDSDRLVLLWNELSAQGVSRAPGSGFELAEIRRRASSFDSVAGIWAGNGTFLGTSGDGAQPEQVKVGSVTGNFFPTLGAQAFLGRTLQPEDEGDGKPRTVLLAHGFWQRRWGGDRDIVGKTVTLDGHVATVAGVMPPGFRMVFPADAQVPAEVQAWTTFPYDVASGPRDLHFLRFVARLKPGTSLAAASDEVAAIGKQLSSEFSELGKDGVGLRAVALRGDTVRDIRPALLALFVGVGLVLLIACVNIANLLLARGGARRNEMAVRAALGASRGRLVRQLLLENLVLAVIGGLAGVGLGGLGLDKLQALAPAGVLPPQPLVLDRAILAFAALATLLSGALFGMAPALAASRVDLAEAMKAGAPGATPRRRRSRAILIVGEIALGFVLLVGAGLMIRTFVAVAAVDPGMREDGVLTFEVSLPGRRYGGAKARQTFARSLERRLSAVPGVEAVGAVSHLPLDDYPNWYSPYAPAGASLERKRQLMADHRATTPGFLPALGAKLVAGRFFDALDEEAGRAVVVIDEQPAAEAWPGEDPIGKRLQHERMLPDGEFGELTSEVIGVVHHIHQHALTRMPRGQIYIPYAATAREHLSFVVRAAGDPTALAGSVRAAVAGVDAELAVAKVRPLAEYLERAMRPARFTMVLATLFAGLALVLAAVGIYGVVATTVGERRRELGVRLVLGATPRELCAQVLREELKLALLGLGLGAAGALVATRLLAGLLFGVAPVDPATFLVATLLLPATALLASWLPARRAAQGDPMAALRIE